MQKKWIAVAMLGVVAAFVVADFAAKEGRVLAEARGFAKGRQVEIDAADARMKSRELTFEKERRALTAERDQIKTAKQAVQVITRYLPQTAKQIVAVKRDELPPAVKAELPDAPSYTCMTEDAAVTLGKAVDDLQLCGKERDKLRSDAADQQTKYAAAVAQRDQFKSAAEGGTKWQRMKSAGKWTAIGVGIGYAVAEALHARR